MKQILYILLMLSTTINVSCAKDPISGNSNDGKLVNVTLSCKVAPMDETTSKSVDATNPKSNNNSNFSLALNSKTSITESNDPQSKSDGTTLLYNFWVFQFDQSGNRVHFEKFPNIPTPIKDMVEIETKLKVGKDQTIYLISMGKALGEDLDLSTIATISELENININYLTTTPEGNISKVKSDEDVPYAGSAHHLTIIEGADENGRGYIKYDQSSDFKGSINMQSMLAKITYKVKYNVAGYSLKTIGLLNVPKTFRINSADPNCKYEQMVQVNVSTLTTNDLGEYVLSWYVALNQQGVVQSITQEYLRYSLAPAGSAPLNGMLIKMWVANNTDAEKMALYWIYLGNNNTNNFNIDPHTHYTFSTAPTSLPTEQDKRIEFISETVTMQSDLMIDNHFDRRGININVSMGELTVFVTQNVNDVTAPTTDSWIKLSAYPNYTAAYQNSDLLTSRTISVKSNQNIKLWAYNDENLSQTSRKIYVKAILRDASDKIIKDINILYSQRQMNIIGNFGGEFDENLGEYSAGLGYEDMCEYATLYPNTEYGIKNDNTYQGYYGINLHGVGYHAEDIYSGKEATLAYVYNANNYAMNNGIPVATPTKNPDGNLNLYQYNYYTEYGARICYNKNRDINGNGKLENNEINWYMPSKAQIMILTTSKGVASSFIATIYTSTTETTNADVNLYNAAKPKSYDFFYSIFLGQTPTTRTQTRESQQAIRCVRDLPKL